MELKRKERDFGPNLHVHQDCHVNFTQIGFYLHLILSKTNHH